jgi:putative CocE/NonD family hydrolase
VCQDVRGRYMSEGDFVNVRPYKPAKRANQDIDETTDTYDTVDWLVDNLEQNNGRVGISGISYPGFFTWMGTIDAHPAVKATSPQAPVSKWMAGDDFFHNGAFLLAHAFNFYSMFGWPRPEPKSEPDAFFDKGIPDEYEFFLEVGPVSNINTRYLQHRVAFWDTITANGRWNDFWAARNTHPHLKDLRPATLVVGGWFDTENLYGALNTYSANEEGSPGAVNLLVMGPWYHAQWNYESGDSLGPIGWGSATARFYTDSIEMPFFDHYLKGNGELNLPEAFVFNTGAKVWHRLDAWPPKNVSETKLYLWANGELGFEPPRAAPGGYDEYIHDPARPVPYTSEITQWYNPAFMLEDQRFAARRPDVLVYESDVLDEDVTIAGPIDVHFVVSTSGTDADWVVKLIDVLPDTLGYQVRTEWFQLGGGVKLGGYQMLVRGDVLRGKFRDSLADPRPFEPNTPTPIHFTLQDAFHTFKKGHRIMVQVQSSWFPMVDRNPGVFTDIFQAKAADFRSTLQRVYHSRERPSYVTVRVWK